MQTFLMYIYRVPKATMGLRDDESIIQFPPSSLVGVVQAKDPLAPTRKSKIEKYNLKPFQIDQELFYLVINQAKELSMQIINIYFRDELEEELEDELQEAIDENNIDKLLLLIIENRKSNNEIDKLAFFYKGRNYSVGKYGIIEVDGDRDSIYELTMNSPVSRILGIKKILG
ncbi:hypothetical protein BCJMU51_4442 [Bacillus cereus]|uniref:hypothetical protein n=1 Tax=Bacillus TaxID=1386 RepID=UPI001F17D7F1|nr:MULTISPECIES: hypothetical protein [Bacillus]MDX9638110.1 hypothetical protein [Bacillus sp. PBL-C9]BCB39523.1 hypothetical protein BCM0045_4418 [Bacillus cereus]BCC02364.1 hypothetical protein BCM0057_4446 [Bacillus cereus]BCC25876.1 hypothetical protein BCM0079_4469 [Bacillus cereus]BCC37444.1 hypothetical protein BCM0105_4434 [Bacillus cereus]